MNGWGALLWWAIGISGGMLFLCLVGNALERSELELRALEQRELNDQRKRAEAAVITCTASRTPASG